jgi:hypothetical protein
VYDTVVAPTPIVSFSAPVDGEWQIRAALSTSLVPRKRATFPAT